MKKVWKLLPTFLGICVILSICSCSGCNKKENEDSFEKELFEEKNVTVNYKDVVSLTEYFGEKDNYSNAELYSPSGEPVSLKNGYLYADTMGTYKLVLNESRIIYNMEVSDISGPIVMLNQQSKNVYLGEEVMINPTVVDNVDEDFNMDTLNYVVKKRGEAVSVSNNSFIAEELGEYVLEFDLQDAAGNKADPVIINCKMPKVIEKPINTKIELSDDIFKGLTDTEKEYIYERKILRVSEDGSSEVNSNTFTIDKKSIYKINQTAKCDNEEITLSYIYCPDGFMIYDFNDQDISLISTAAQSGITSGKTIKKLSEEDYGVLISNLGGKGWNTLYISGLEPNTTYDRISFEVSLTEAPRNDKDPLRLSFYNKQGESGHTVLGEDKKQATAIFSDITTDAIGTAKLYAYIHIAGDTKYTIDNLIVQKSGAVNMAKGVYISFAGGAKSVEKANTGNEGYSTLHLDVQNSGWSSLKIFATKEAGFKANTEYRVWLDVACDGQYPSFYQLGGSDFAFGSPGGRITFTITTDKNGEFTKVWEKIYMNMAKNLSYIEFTGIEIIENIGDVYGDGISVIPAKRNNEAVFTATEKVVKDGVNAGKTYSCIENITKGGWSMLTVSADRKAGLKANTEYRVTLDVSCEGNADQPLYHEKGNTFILRSPGGKITFKVTTDKNGEFTKVWEQVFINMTNGLSRVAFTGIEIAEDKGTIYGEGITVVPARRNNAAVFTATEKAVKDGANAGKTYSCIENITKGGWSMLTVAANRKAGLKANTEYRVTLDLTCEGNADQPLYHEKENAFVLRSPGGKITFKVTTDKNGEFTKVWEQVFINMTNGLSRVAFTGIEIAEDKGDIYGEGITVLPALRNQQAVFTVTEKTVESGENAGKTYKCIENITKSGYSLLTVSAAREAGLKANTKYDVVLTVECDGSTSNALYHGGGFTLKKPGGTITFTITTDANGEFTKTWEQMYVNYANGVSYVGFTGITITEVKKSVYGEGITVLPALRNQQAVFTVTEKTVESGENAGKTYKCIENITKGGWSMLTVSAGREAGLKANTEYTVTLDVSCEGNAGQPLYHASGTEGFIMRKPGGKITFTITTDANGEFTKIWEQIYINMGNGLSYVGFTGIGIIEKNEVARVLNYNSGATVVRRQTQGLLWNKNNNTMERLI